MHTQYIFHVTFMKTFIPPAELFLKNVYVSLVLIFEERMQTKSSYNYTGTTTKSS